MTYRRSAIEIAILLVTVCIAGWPLLTGSALTGHDLISHLTYAQQTAANIRLGELLPAWGGSFNGGFGSPALIFYPPFTQTIHAIPMLLGADAVTVLGPMALVSLFVSGLAFRACCRELAGPAAATAAALVYMVAPYRLINVFERAALPESWAFLWPPLIVWAATRRAMPAHRQTVLVAIFTAGLILTNLPLALLFLTGLSAWFVLILLTDSSDPQTRHRWRSVAWGAVTALGLSCFMLVPQALARRWLSMDHMFGGDAGALRPSANTLFNPASFHPEFNTRISTVLLVTAGIIIVATLLHDSARARLLLRCRRRSSSPGEKPEKGRRFLLLLLAAVICVACTVPPIGAWLDFAPIYSNIQFPWRIAALLTFIAAAMVSLLPPRRAWIMVCLTALVTVPYSGRNLMIPKSNFNTLPADTRGAGKVFPDPVAVAEAGATGGPWRHRNMVDVAFIPLATRDLILAELAEMPQPQLDTIRNRPAVLLESRDTPITIIEWTSLRRTARLTTEVPGTLLWRSLVFPGLEVSCSGKRVHTLAHSTTGLLSHRIQPGNHVLTWQWRPFPLLRFGYHVSLATCVVLAALWLWPQRRRS
jgi:hypothetical protein